MVLQDDPYRPSKLIYQYQILSPAVPWICKKIKPLSLPNQKLCPFMSHFPLTKGIGAISCNISTGKIAENGKFVVTSGIMALNPQCTHSTYSWPVFKY